MIISIYLSCATGTLGAAIWRQRSYSETFVQSSRALILLSFGNKKLPPCQAVYDIGHSKPTTLDSNEINNTLIS